MKDKHAKAYMECAQAFARCSVSKRGNVGAVIVKNNRIISCGYNALPEHLDGPLEDENGDTKPEVRHAEKNALMGLVRSSESAIGATLFCTKACCKFCAIDIVDAGITTVYYQEEYRLSEGIEYLYNNGVAIFKI
jgi:dCMP deaminase